MAKFDPTQIRNP